VTEVLNYVQFHATDLLATFRRKVSNAKDLTRQEANSFIADFVAGLEGYTYLEGDVEPEDAERGKTSVSGERKV
jgi:arginine decarboxylase